MRTLKDIYNDLKKYGLEITIENTACKTKDDLFPNHSQYLMWQSDNNHVRVYSDFDMDERWNGLKIVEVATMLIGHASMVGEFFEVKQLVKELQQIIKKFGNYNSIEQEENVVES